MKSYIRSGSGNAADVNGLFGYASPLDPARVASQLILPNHPNMSAAKTPRPHDGKDPTGLRYLHPSSRSLVGGARRFAPALFRPVSRMNMLLPFLLDADTRRIDAAGEQSGVLKGRMLSGRDEPQPQGYLWLEVAKDETHLSFGCGIRANRATDQVTTWWFITTRRAGIDFQLIEDRVPVSRDTSRAAIAPDPLYGQELRADYRAELRRRIFGGADIEQHLHLLRIVRNPRVGDRLDEELPQYLQDALPQLSEAALDDAYLPSRPLRHWY